MKYSVSWSHLVKQNWVAIVEANSRREAVQAIKDGNYGEEECIDENGLGIDDIHVEEYDNE